MQTDLKNYPVEEEQKGKLKKSKENVD